MVLDYILWAVLATSLATLLISSHAYAYQRGRLSGLNEMAEAMIRRPSDSL